MRHHLGTQYSVLSTLSRTTSATLLLLVIFAANPPLSSAEPPPLPQLDDAQIAATGIRKLTSQHIVLYTDLPPAPEIDELPRVFDAAVPLWCSYFGVDPVKLQDWKLIGCVIGESSKDRFIAAGLYPPELPPFRHGYARGRQLWIYDQPSSYYRRHLLLHEGTHQFMEHWLGGTGPPWYSEGLAELLGTHRWQMGTLALGIVPRTKEDVPYWGRVKVIKDDFAAGRAFSLIDVMRFDGKAHLRTEAYAWSWAITYFFDQHPLTQQPFRELKTNTRARWADFSRRFYDGLKDQWLPLSEDWQLFVGECDYGYDVARAAIVRKNAVELPAAGSTITIAADRGWQSAGFRLQAGTKYRLAAEGRFQVANSPKPWPCEAGGVTIRYHRGHPLGMLLAAISDVEGDAPTMTPLAAPQPIGLAGELVPERTGTLYLKINEAPSGLADNTGQLRVQIQ